MTDNTISDLCSKIAAIEGREIELAGERNEIAYEALIGGNAKAAKRLTEVNAELGHLQGEKATIEAALAEAGRRAVAAAAAQDADAERERAEKAKPIVKRLEERGAKMDAAMKTYRDEFAAIKDDIIQLDRLGVPTPSRHLVEVNTRLAHDAALTPLGDKFVRPVPPTARRTFTFLLKGWALPARNWIDSKLNNKSAKAA